MIFSTKRESTTQLEDLRFPWDTMTPLCRNCIPCRGSESWGTAGHRGPVGWGIPVGWEPPWDGGPTWDGGVPMGWGPPGKVTNTLTMSWVRE